MDRQHLIALLDRYNTPFPDEQLFIPRFRSLLVNFKNCFSRSLTTGHITASAWVLDASVESALLVHHRKLNRWLQPGGHADGEENIGDVATREVIEETGLHSLQLSGTNIFDVDIHQIPAHGMVQAHFHYDIRFLFIADKTDPIVVSDESHDVRWFSLDSISDVTANSASIGRMTMKSRQFFQL